MTTTRTTELVLGSEVRCSDGPAAVLRRVIVDPPTRSVTHLVVTTLHRPTTAHLVPIGLLDPLAPTLQLGCTTHELLALESAEDVSLLGATGPPSAADHDALLGWPYYGIGGGGVGMGFGMDSAAAGHLAPPSPTDRVPYGDVQLQQREQVHGLDGDVGRVRGLVMAAEGHQVTQVLIDVGQRWDTRRTAVPIAAVLSMTDVVSVDLTRDEVRRLAADAAPDVGDHRSATPPPPHSRSDPAGSGPVPGPRTRRNRSAAPVVGSAATPLAVVVGVDDSAASAAALDRALAEAASTGRPVLAVRAWTTPVWLGGAPGAYPLIASSDASRRAAGHLLDAAVSAALGRRSGGPAVDVRTRLVEGEPGRHLVRLAADAGLVVVGGRHHGELVGAVLGSATGYVLHHAQCPVMIVPTPSPSRGAGRVVVGVDGSPPSRAALRFGLDAAQRHGCGLTAVHAGLAAQADGAAARHWLSEEVAAALPPGHGVEVSQQVRCGSVTKGLLDVTKGSDLLVVGSRGHGGFAALVLGSVAMQCAQHAPGPVVVVRADQARLRAAAPAVAGAVAAPA